MQIANNGIADSAGADTVCRKVRCAQLQFREAVFSRIGGILTLASTATKSSAVRVDCGFCPW